MFNANVWMILFNPNDNLKVTHMRLKPWLKHPVLMWIRMFPSCIRVALSFQARFVQTDGWMFKTGGFTIKLETSWGIGYPANFGNPWR